MASDSKLTYYDYWLTKKVWSAEHALNIITNYYVFSLLFDGCDDYDYVKNRFREDLAHKMAHDDAMNIYAKRSFEIAGYKDGDWVEGSLIIENCDVKPNEYIKWLHHKGYNMPYEFKKFAGIAEINTTTNAKLDQKMDKAVCQGIARTLWDIYPNMTQEDMLHRKEIQLYGNGIQYSSDTTLRRWLREVDPRETKTGPKKII